MRKVHPGFRRKKLAHASPRDIAALNSGDVRMPDRRPRLGRTPDARAAQRLFAGGIGFITASAALAGSCSTP
jgi:hypothetical protein